MDSRLLNVVYDDPFDGNYAEYDDTEFWSSGSETMGMQLTETLHGILPIAPTEDFHKDTTSINIQNNKNAFNYEDFAGQHLTAGGAIEIVTVNPHADIYDTDSEDEEESDDNEDNDDDDDEDGDNNLLEFDHQSQCSNATFRTRTDSSSIGDYESHTSDYDDETDDDEKHDSNLMANNALTLQKLQNNNVTNGGNHSITLDLHSSLVAPDDLILDTSYHHKSRTLSTNTINSDVDGFGLQIDGNNFDLAEFITKDDFNLQITSTRNATLATTTCTTSSTKTNVLPKTTDVLTNVTHTPSTVVQVISSKHSDSDSDSDFIVDIETVEMDEDDASTLRKASDILKPSCTEMPKLLREEDIAYVDNLKSDPSWCPTQQPAKKLEIHKVEEKSPTQKQNFARNFSLVPSKKQCDILKGKAAKGNKAKTTQKPTKATSAKNIKIENPPLKDAGSIIKTENLLRKTGMGMGGKNLALLKHERVSISEQSSEDNNTPIKIVNNNTPPVAAAALPPPLLIPQQMSVTIKSDIETPAHNNKAQAIKRKLNLEEYKKRRGGGESSLALANGSQTKFESHKMPKLESNNTNTRNSTVVINAPTPTKHSAAVTSIVKTLKEQQNLQQQNHKTDPITEARNKVLRMQELKRAQQMRIIDSTISAKVPRVTKLLPLREIVKDTPYLNEDEKKLNSKNSQKTQQTYEEIITVSTSCNTDISIPPKPNQNIQPVNNASRSLLKSSALLSTISNSFEKVKATDNLKISTSSLISSIQDVVVNKSLPIEEDETEKSFVHGSLKSEHHGENKIIMHLRKDRIRKRMCTIGIQTELQPEFPPLPLSKSSMQHKSRERTRKQRKRQYRKHNDQPSSSSSEYSSDEHTDSNSSSLTRSRDPSWSSSVERMRTYDSAIGTGGYSSRSSPKHCSSISSSYSESADRVARGQRRQRRTSYTKRSSRSKRSRSPYSSSSSYTSDSDRSRSPLYRRSSRSRSNSRTHSRRSSHRQANNNNFLDRNVSQPAVEERRIVYVGRIEQETTKEMLRRKFLTYGTIKQISIHFKDTGMKYGFVTFERSQDAFFAIDNSTRDPQINMYDVSFGGRRAFCRATYADLDNAGINTYQSYVFPQPTPQPKEEDSFEALLQKMKAKLNANKTTTSTNATTATTSVSTTAVSVATAANSNNTI